ncbi:MAG: putative phage-related protein [Devosia sp.]|uniref:DUF3037 domain-containing protein n=1 Tax=Devosia sp. TaxID=1871048 RepID=UPI00260CF69E|nr:DUF3037 domain-containing protein [Devosia sp.]MDB5529201.1 putative phage-related protein [Devosia sp.]
MGRIAEYAILRFVPEAHRGELINVGLVVFRDSRLDVRLFLHAAVFKAIGVSPTSLDWVSAYLREIDDPSAEPNQRWERLSKIPSIVLSEPGWLMADSDEQYEIRIQRIREDYIDRPKLPMKRKKSSSLVRELRTVFREYHVMGKDTSDLLDHKVVPNVPVGPSGKLQIDFVVKNGIYHATETADFRSAHDVGTAELKEAALAAITLQCAREQLGHYGVQCYFVYSASVIIETAINPALQIAERSVDRMFNIESGDQRRDYFDLMLSATGSPSLFNSN